MRAWPPGTCFALSTIGLATVLYLGYASFMVLHTGCVLCIGTYVCVLVIFVLSSLSRSVSIMGLPLRLFRDIRDVVARPVTLAADVAALCGHGVARGLLPERGGRGRTGSVGGGKCRARLRRCADRVRAHLGAATQGRPRHPRRRGAEVIIVKFNDYMCPMCRIKEAEYKPILERFAQSDPGKVKLVVKDWPWNSTCNFNARSTIPGHEAACDAAAAARMARDRGKADEMVEWLFANQGTLARQRAAGGLEDFGYHGLRSRVHAQAAADQDGHRRRRRVADQRHADVFRQRRALARCGPSAGYLELAISLELKQPAK